MVDETNEGVSYVYTPFKYTYTPSDQVSVRDYQSNICGLRSLDISNGVRHFLSMSKLPYFAEILH